MRVGLCGVGRIGRTILRAMAQRDLGRVVLAACCDVAPLDQLDYLLRYDTVRGPSTTMGAADGHIYLGRNVRAEYVRSSVPPNWAALDVDLVIEATGRRTERGGSLQHIQAGARRVIVTAPCEDATRTIVFGFNETEWMPSDQIVSTASCTTNCLVPMLAPLMDQFGVESALISTVHSYTADQRLVDSPHADLRRGRAAGVNIVPTTTGAARATGLVLSRLSGRVDGRSFRVPIPDVSLVDLTVCLEAEASAAELNHLYERSARQSSVMKARSGPIVSSDILNCSESCTIDLDMTLVTGRLAKVIGWYDNEWGYANRVVDVLLHIAEGVET